MINEEFILNLKNKEKNKLIIKLILTLIYLIFITIFFIKSYYSYKEIFEIKYIFLIFVNALIILYILNSIYKTFKNYKSYDNYEIYYDELLGFEEKIKKSFLGNKYNYIVYFKNLKLDINKETYNILNNYNIHDKFYIIKLDYGSYIYNENEYKLDENIKVINDEKIDEEPIKKILTNKDIKKIINENKDEIKKEYNFKGLYFSLFISILGFVLNFVYNKPFIKTWIILSIIIIIIGLILSIKATKELRELSNEYQIIKTKIIKKSLVEGKDSSFKTEFENNDFSNKKLYLYGRKKLFNYSTINIGDEVYIIKGKNIFVLIDASKYELENEKYKLDKIKEY